jgi:hypothetical protein
MRKKLSLVTVLLLLLAVAAVVVASASARDEGENEFTLIGTVVEETDIDLGPTGDSQGDQFVFTDDLFKEGKHVGWNGGVCTVVRLVPEVSASLQCVATFSLPEGQITVQGLVTFEFEDAPAPLTVAITGGTDAYERAQGELTVEDVSETETRYTFDLG